MLSTLSKKLLSADGTLSQENFGLASRIFGTRSVSTLLALLRQLGDGYDELSTKVNNANGVMRDTADAQLEGIKPFYRLQAAWAKIQIAISESGIMDALADLADTMADFFNKVSSAEEKTKRLGFNILLLTAVSGPAVFIMGLLVTQVANIARGLLMLSAVISFFLTPIGLATGAVLLLAGVFAYTAFDGITSFQQLMDGLGPIINGIANIILSLVGFVISAVSGDWNTAWGYAKDVAAYAGSLIVMIITEVANILLSIFQSILQFTVDNWEQISNKIMEALDWLFTSTEGWILLFFLLMHTGFRHTAVGVVSIFAQMVNHIVRMSLALFMKMKPLWGPFWEALLIISRAAARPIVGAFKTMYEGVLYITRKFFVNMRRYMRRFAFWFVRVFRRMATAIAGKAMGTRAGGLFLQMSRNITTALINLSIKVRAIMTKIGIILLSPIKLAIAALVAAFVGLVIAIKDELVRGAKGAGTVFKLMLADALDFVMQAASAIQAFVSDPKGAVTGIIDLGFGGWFDTLEGDYGLGDPYAWFGVERGMSYEDAWDRGSDDLEGEDFIQALTDAGEAIKAFGLEAAEFVFSGLVDVGKIVSDFIFPNEPFSLLSTYLHHAGLAFQDEGFDANADGPWAFMAKAAGEITKGVIKVVGEGSKVAMEAALGGLGHILTDLNLMVQQIEPLHDVDLEAVKAKIYDLLGGEGAPTVPVGALEMLHALGEGEGGQESTPEERKASVIDFIQTLTGDIKTTLENLFAPSEETGELNAENVVQQLQQMGYDVEGLGKDWKDIIDSIVDDPDDLIDDDKKDGLDGDRTGFGANRSLTGALKDITMNFRIWIGDTEFEDLVVNAVQQARQSGRAI